MEDKNRFEFDEKNNINNSENKTPNDSSDNVNNSEDKKPFFLMTLEDSMGKCQQIKIYQNSNPSELAYYFCKENNLDFASMKYIKSNIKSIVKKFNEPQQKTLLYNNSNNAIKEEEDEDDYLTEGTVRSNNNEKQKIQDNEEDNYSNSIYKDKKKSEVNNDTNNENEIKDNNDTNNNNSDFNNKNNNNKFNHYKEFQINEKNEQIIDISNKKDKADKSKKTFENINAHIKSINAFGKIPLKINQISPKQIEINENILKIINNNKNENIIIDNDSTNNIHLENNNEINKSNYNNTTDRSRNSGYISIIDKEIKEITDSIKSRERTKVSDNKENNINHSPKNINNNKKDSNKDIKNNNSNFNINYFGDKYINFNKKSFDKKSYENECQNPIRNEISKSADKSSESMEYGVPVLNSESNIEKENNIIEINNNNELTFDKNETVRNKDNKDDNNINDNNNYGNKINKEIILNKMKKIETDKPKKNIKRNNEINKLLHLIKNSCYNTNKNIRNKIIKDKQCTNNNVDRLKAKESNSLDINYEISRNIETESNNIYSKELFNNVCSTNDNKYKKNNHINTNFNAYIVNNKFNYKRCNNKHSNNELNPNITNRKYFFSNPNLSSNQEVNNLNKGIYTIKNNFKSFKKNELPIKSKSLGKEKNKKISSTSKNKIKLYKKYNETVNSKMKEKKLMKEKKKKCFLKFKSKYNINNNSSTQNNIDDRNNKCLNLKTCQTPPTKKGSYTYHHINSIFSEWIMSTINRDSRNVFTTRENYFNKNNEITKTSKSVSELPDNTTKNSNYRMILSKSTFKNGNPNLIMNGIKYSTKNNLSKEINNNKNKHHYINSLKIINKTNTLYNKNNNKNLNNNINNNDKKIINRKINGRNNIMIKKTLEKLKYINSVNKNANLDTINDYNFNNNNFYLRRFINNTIHSFIYNSSENSKSEDKYKKIIQKQLTSPSKAKYFEIKAKKKKRGKKIGHKNALNKIDKILLNNSSPNENNKNNNDSNNIHINNLININNYQKNKNYNVKYIQNGNNHFIKNSRLKKNKIENKINSNNINKIENNKRLINFSNELKKYYLNTEINKNNFNNMTYSNFINNNISLSNYDLSADEKINDEILINIFNKVYIFLNKEKSDSILLMNSCYKKIISCFPPNIRNVLKKMIEILCLNYGKKKKNYFSNNSLLTSTKNNENQLKINKNNFIYEMLYIYKYYLNSENKKLIISNKDIFYKINQENIADKNPPSLQKNNNKKDYSSPKSYQKKSQYKTKTDYRNIAK